MRMKTLMLGLSLLMMGLSTAKVQAQDGSLVLDLQQCLEFAMANNQNVLNADLEKTKQEKVVKQTLSIGYPQITSS